MTPRRSQRAAARERYRALTTIELREAQGATIDAVALAQFDGNAAVDSSLPDRPATAMMRVGSANAQAFKFS